MSAKVLYAVMAVSVCGNVSAPGQFIVVTIKPEFMDRLKVAIDLIREHKFSEIESLDLPEYSYIDDLNWMPAPARKIVEKNKAALVRCEPTVFFDLSDGWERMCEEYQDVSRCVNFIPNGFQIVERMDCGEELYATFPYPFDGKVKVYEG